METRFLWRFKNFKKIEIQKFQKIEISVGHKIEISVGPFGEEIWRIQIDGCLAERDHQSIKCVMKRFFNMMVKNLKLCIRKLSSGQEMGDKRKPAKLSSRTSAKR